MKDKELQMRIENAVNTTLASLTPTEAECQRIVYRATHPREKRIPRVSFSLALAVVILLLTMSAAAAAVFLSTRQIVEEKAIPMALETAGESYSAAQTEQFVKLARENGIDLSENTLRQIDEALSQGEGYFKEEMLMAFAKAEFGENPAAWTLEQQDWFDDVCVIIGFVPEKEKAFPEGGEETKNPIIAAAVSHVWEQYGKEIPLLDGEQYETGVQYLNGNVDGQYPGMYWSVVFTPRQTAAREYWVYLDENGQIIGDDVTGAKEAEPVHKAYLTVSYQEAEARYGTNPFFWPLEVQAELLGDLGRTLPREGEMSRDEAVAFARTYLPGDAEAMLGMPVENCLIGVLYERMNAGTPEEMTRWTVFFTDTTAMENGYRVVFLDKHPAGMAPGVDVGEINESAG